MSTMGTWLQDDRMNPVGFLFGGVGMLFWLSMVVLVIVGGWKVFEKAGQPGWAILIPIYNLYILLKIAGRPGWWLLLYLIPIVNFVIGIMVAIDIAKSFGQGGAFGFFLLFLFSGIGFIVLGFGNYSYRGPAAISG